MNYKAKLLPLVFIAVITLLWAGCQDSTTGPGKVKLQPVTNLKAYSASNTSVVLKWTKSTNENLADLVNYIIKVKTLDNNTVRTTSVPKGADSSVVIASLNNGMIYRFEITSQAAATSEGYINSDSVTIKWSPAWRFDTEGTIPIQVYERTSGTGFASGLIFYYSQTSLPKTISLLNADSSQIDVFVDTKTGSNVALSSSHLYRANRRITRFSTVSISSNTLNDPQITPPDTTTYTLYEIPVDSVAATTSKIIYYKGVNGNYGRILIERNLANGTLIYGSSLDQYLHVRISYQSVAYNPYSKTSK
ncbi:MAG: fibronectin type III domain-containing protein [Bacteroidota bacterium]|nr:fibronectin type III domain-containing protein [Bacteroidota bacterium]